MKIFATLLAVLVHRAAEATKVLRSNPTAKTAFCLSGNVRGNHGLEESKNLKQRMDDIDPDGLSFAFVNPCQEEIKPWSWDNNHRGVPWHPKDCADPWGKSYWKKVLKPTVLKEYRDKDVAPPDHKQWCPHGTGWMVGVFQQFTGVRECFRLIEEYEKQNNFKFETVVRLRADACGGGPYPCDHIRYCHVDKLDKSKTYMHFQSNTTSYRLPEASGHFNDNFAIVPRKFATGFFHAIENYKRCDLGGPGETLMNYQVHKLMLKQWYNTEPMVVEDKCECHDHKFCMKQDQPK